MNFKNTPILVQFLPVFLIFLFAKQAYAELVWETPELTLSMSGCSRIDTVNLKNSVDLDSANSDDTSTYLGIDYNIAFSAKLKNSGTELYLKFERNGPTDYDAPVFTHNTLMTSGGVIEDYQNDELLPNLEEFWVDTPLAADTHIKAGLYSYEVGNGFSLNGGYENYGVSVYKEWQGALWRIYYCRPDLVYKNHLGPRIRQDEEQGVEYNHNAANFFATDIKFKKGENCLNPYIGVLADYTSSGKRDSAFSAQVKRDILGTAGISWSYDSGGLQFCLEAARNFGRAESSDADYKDIYHQGYLVYTGSKLKLGRFIPRLDFLVASGNKATIEDAEAGDTTSASGKNKAFSVCSPLNKNLGDSISSINAEVRPVVAMGAGYGLNYGVPRPETFSATDFDNIILPAIGFDFNLNDKLCLGVYGYYLFSFARGVATLNSQGRYLSRELGKELDLFLDYKISDDILVSFLGGMFFPGRYYKQERDDTSGSLFSPFVRGDGEADSAYQLEVAVEMKF